MAGVLGLPAPPPPSPGSLADRHSRQHELYRDYLRYKLFSFFFKCAKQPQQIIHFSQSVITVLDIRQSRVNRSFVSLIKTGFYDIRRKREISFNSPTLFSVNLLPPAASAYPPPPPPPPPSIPATPPSPTSPLRPRNRFHPPSAAGHPARAAATAAVGAAATSAAAAPRRSASTRSLQRPPTRPTLAWQRRPLPRPAPPTRRRKAAAAAARQSRDIIGRHRRAGAAGGAAQRATATAATRSSPAKFVTDPLATNTSSR